MNNKGDEGGSAFQFHGNWREFAPIAFTNLLLTLVTLGVYTFWARTRERRYLWSQTRFIDDRLEWTGTGLELFIGYLLAMLIFGVPLIIAKFFIPTLASKGYEGVAAVVLLGIYIGVMYLIGVAIFRALRYRLSRTYWHGIRGGTNDPGLRYGLSHLWKTIAGGMALGLLVPWSMVSLWNERWNGMSFGPFAFTAKGRAGGLMGRYLLFYLLPIVIAVGGVIIALVTGSTPANSPAGFFLVFFGVYLLFFVGLGIVSIFFYAAYFREVVGNLSLGDLDFEFTASSMDWLKLMVGNIGLVIVTLGIGTIFLGYRNWSFFIRHLSAYGTLTLDDFTQSETRAPGQGEGLLDAFDVGAF